MTEADAAFEAMKARNADHCAAQLAMISAVRGDADAAFQWLERGYAQRDSGVAFVISWWMFEPLRTDPRWSPFIKKMGFADSARAQP